MIHYALVCSKAHDFDGWFQNSASFETQAQAGLLECPVCASTSVRRALMAPLISASAAQPAHASPPVKAVAAMPAQMRAALQRIRAEVESRCDYVGPRFAAEVRRIAEGEGPERRPIYGEATREEAAALEADGIEVARIPWVPLADS